MKVSEAFPSNYLEAGDLDGKEITVEIASIDGHHEGKGNDGKAFVKPLVRFKGAKKGMVLNKTNAKRIELILGYGAEMDSWIGKPVTLYATMTRFGKKKVPCVRVKVPEEFE